MSLRARMVNLLLRLFRRLGWLRRYAPLLADPSTRAEALAVVRRGDARRPPRRLLRRRSAEQLDIDGSVMWLLAHTDRPGERVVLYLHGGGYVTGPNPPHWWAMDDVTTDAGADLAMFLYPRSPEHDAPAIVAATVSAYRRVVDRYGADNVVVAGDSAGGGLTALLLMALRDQQIPQPHAAILISPWLDVAADEPGLEQQAATDLMLELEPVRITGRLFARDLDPSDPRVSPLHGSTHGLAPIHVFVGTDELFLPECRAFVAKARANGDTVTLRELPHGQHVSALFPTPEGRIARAQMVALTGWP